MKVIGSRLVIELLSKEGALWKCQESGLKRKKLSHYTSADVLKKIITDKVMKFNRIDKVNDVLESEQFGYDDLSHLVYVSCFSYDEYESVPMWMIYGHNEYSVRLTLELNENDFSKNFIDDQGIIINPTDNEIISIKRRNRPICDWLCDYKTKDILYSRQEIDNNPIRIKVKSSGDHNREIYNLTVMGSMKSEEWSFEKETRVIACLRNTTTENEFDVERRNGLDIPDIDYLLVPIKFDKLKSITVTFSPWMNVSTKTDIKLFMEKMSRTELAGVEIKCQNSILTGETNFS